MIGEQRVALATVACAALILSGCSAFQGRRVTNLAPFAENTMGLVSGLRLTSPQPAHIRSFLQDNEDVRAARELAQQIRSLLRGIIVYSMQVAAIDNSRFSEPEKSRELARYLDEVLRAAIRSQGVSIALTEAQLDSVLARVRAQDKYLAALGEANAIVTVVVETADQVIGATESHVLTAAASVSAAIEADFAPYRANDEGLRALESRTMRTYVLLSRARLGDTTAVGELRATEPTLGPAARVPPEELARLEQETIGRLEAIRTLREQLRPEVERYANRVQELDEMVTRSLVLTREARALIILWGRAHRNMAAGIALPPEIDVTGLLKGTISKLPGF